jgi:hypothetical protein
LILLPKSLTEADNLPQKRPRFSLGLVVRNVLGVRSFLSDKKS